MQKNAESMRKKPQQSRAQQTLDDIFEATARIFEAGPPAPLNTNKVAERAGVSIGTLYYYFPNKQSLLRAMALREIKRQEARFLACIAAARPHGTDAVVRAVVREAMAPLNGRKEVRRYLMVQVGLEPAVHHSLYQALNRVTDRLLEAVDIDPASLSPERHFLLLRSMLGPVRAAALNVPEMLVSPAFETELVKQLTAQLVSLRNDASSDRDDERPEGKRR